MAEFVTIAQHFPGGTKEYHDNILRLIVTAAVQAAPLPKISQARYRPRPLTQWHFTLFSMCYKFWNLQTPRHTTQEAPNKMHSKNIRLFASMVTRRRYNNVAYTYPKYNFNNFKYIMAIHWCLTMKLKANSSYEYMYGNLLHFKIPFLPTNALFIKHINF